MEGNKQNKVVQIGTLQGCTGADLSDVKREIVERIPDHEMDLARKEAIKNLEITLNLDQNITIALFEDGQVRIGCSRAVVNGDIVQCLCMVPGDYEERMLKAGFGGLEDREITDVAGWKEEMRLCKNANF